MRGSAAKGFPSSQGVLCVSRVYRPRPRRYVRLHVGRSTLEHVLGEDCPAYHGFLGHPAAPAHFLRHHDSQLFLLQLYPLGYPALLHLTTQADAE